MAAWPTEALIAHVVVSKFCRFPAAVSAGADAVAAGHHAGPLDAGQLGWPRLLVAARRSTICWLGTVLSSPKVFADDTTLPVLEPGRGRTKTGRLWCYAVDDRPWSGPGHPAAAYVYSEDRKGARPAGHLAEFRGVLQVDGYAGFKRLAGDRADGSVTLAFCWAHMRRPFYEFHVSTKSPLAAEVLARIARTLCDRGRNPRPFRRASTTGAPGAKPADRRSPACLAARACRTRLRRLRSGQGDALRHPALARPGASSSTTAASRSVESTTGAVAVGSEELPLSGGFRRAPVPQFGPWLRFQSPLVKPDVQISRIRLSPVPSNLRSRQVGTPAGDAVEAERLVEILVRDLAEPGASSSRAAHQPATDTSIRVRSDKLIDVHDRPLIEVAAPAAKHAADAGHRALGFVGVPLSATSARGCVGASSSPTSSKAGCRYTGARPCRRSDRPCSRGSRTIPRAAGRSVSWPCSPPTRAASSAPTSAPSPPPRCRGDSK